jgi:hypothetical protein
MTRGRDMKVLKIKKDEKGFALILALVTMAAMTLIGMSVVMNMTIDVQLSSNEREGKLALLGAEAGVQEALSRLHLPGSSARYVGEAPTTTDPRDTSWTTSFDSTTVNESGLNYSVSIKYLLEDNTEGYCDSNNLAPNDSGNSVLPPFTCDTTSDEVIMFGQDFKIDPTVTKVSQGTFPVYEVTSTGTSPQNTQRTIIAYIGASGLNTETDDAINTNGCVSNNGGVAVSTICYLLHHRLRKRGMRRNKGGHNGHEHPPRRQPVEHRRPGRLENHVQRDRRVHSSYRRDHGRGLGRLVGQYIFGHCLCRKYGGAGHNRR